MKIASVSNFSNFNKAGKSVNFQGGWVIDRVSSSGEPQYRYDKNATGKTYEQVGMSSSGQPIFSPSKVRTETRIDSNGVPYKVSIEEHGRTTCESDNRPLGNGPLH